MSKLKDLIKKHKKLEVQINKISKSRLYDRSSQSWIELRTLKKEKLILKSDAHRGTILDIKGFGDGDLQLLRSRLAVN